MYGHTVIIISFYYILLVCKVLCNPMTDCIYKLNSETICFNSYDCSIGCNGKSSCDAYCSGLSTRNSRVIVDDCIKLGSTIGYTFKSLCKCKFQDDWKNLRQGPKGLAGVACSTVYLGQLFKGAIKIAAVP